MADDRGLSGTPSPLGGAALRQAKRREQRLFSGAVPSGPETSPPRLWTQFSGMPNQPGSPTSLHQWLHSVDNTEISLESGAFPPSPSSAASHGNSSLDTFSAAEYLGSGGCADHKMSSPVTQDRMMMNSAGCQDRLMSSPHPGMGQHFIFSSGFESSPDLSAPVDYGSLHSPLYTHTHTLSSPLSSLSADLSRLPPAEFIHHPPDFSFQTPLPDFSSPPQSYLSVLPSLSATSDPPHQSIADFLLANSASCYSPSSRESSTFEEQLGSNLHAFDSAGMASRAATTRHSSLPGNIDISLRPPVFTGFSTITDDILFQNTADVVDPPGQIGANSFDRATTPVQKKIQRQNSEPVYSATAADEGKAIYTDVLRHFNSFGPSYEPFGSTDQLQNPHIHYMSDEPPVNVIKQPKAKESVQKEPSKLSYSDVAKTFRGKLSSSQAEVLGSEKSEAENVLKTSTTEPMTLQSKPLHPVTNRRSFTHTRIINQRSKLQEGGGHSSSTYMQPNSRYGLDQFEDISDLAGAEQQSSSIESLNSPPLHHGVFPRRSSVSSGGTSMVEENRTSKSPPGVDTMGSQYMLGSKDIPQDRVYNNTTSSSATSHHKPASNTTTSAAKSEKLFFDPKRIFQSRSSKEPAVNVMTDKSKNEERGHSSKGDNKEETVLNNGKPNNATGKASAQSHHRKTDYINNDLREGSGSGTTGSCGGGGGGGGAGSGGVGNKQTNQTAAAFSRHGSHSGRKNSGKNLPQNGSAADRARGGDTRGRRQEQENEEDHKSFIHNIDWVLVDEWMKYISDCAMTFAYNSFSAILTLLVYILGIIMYLTMGTIHLMALAVSKLWTMLRGRFFKEHSSGSWAGIPAENTHKRFGVEENITLPTTGEDAMKRLLACKGKDPYSILGLRSDASDEEIKRHYRRQAVLVHPDKNQEPGAEEAFKILGHAFEMIGEPSKRREYDTHIFEASEAEAAMREFSDLLTKLQEKVQEAANMMRCDQCGGKHRRVPVERAWYSARYCDRCNIRHSVKEGEVWAESSMLGFLWHYYACMDSCIYDITDWVSCQKENFKYMKANAHHVLYRIQTDISRRHRQGQTGEADLEDFINRLFTKASMSGDGAPTAGWQFPSQQSGAGPSQHSSWGASSTTSSSSSKRSRRKKKRN